MCGCGVVARVTAWFKRLDGTGKSLAALGGAVIVGLILAGSGWFGLPAQVEVNTSEITVNKGEINGVQQKMDRMICLQLLPEGGNPLACP